MKHIFIATVGLAMLASTSFAAEFRGRVTAVDSNDNTPGLGFTAVDAQGQVKMFRIDSLKHLDLNDRVVVTYPSSAKKFPIRATTVKFLPPRG